MIAALVSATVTVAQRPTATLITNSLLRLDLDGFKLFADAPPHGSDVVIGPEDIALYTLEPTAPVVGGRTFMPSIEGEVLERRSERLGEKTAIYVHPAVTPYKDAPHLSLIHI